MVPSPASPSKQRTRLSWGTVTSSDRELLDKGILTEIGSVTTRVGRRPVQIDLDTGNNHVLGMHLGSTLVRSVLVDVKGAVVESLDLPLDSNGSSREILGRMLKAAREILKRRAVGPRSLGGIGIAAPGAVDFNAGVCLYAPHHPHWKDVPLKRKFEQELGVPCFVDHVSNCYALSEKLFGHGKDLDTFICVLLGTGVSAGIVIGGEVYRGAECFSGEFGHTCIDMDGPLCACGNNGCIEAYASGPAIACAALEGVARAQRSWLWRAGRPRRSRPRPCAGLPRRGTRWLCRLPSDGSAPRGGNQQPDQRLQPPVHHPRRRCLSRKRILSAQPPGDHGETGVARLHKGGAGVGPGTRGGAGGGRHGPAAAFPTGGVLISRAGGGA